MCKINGEDNDQYIPIKIENKILIEKSFKNKNKMTNRIFFLENWTYKVYIIVIINIDSQSQSENYKKKFIEKKKSKLFVLWKKWRKTKIEIFEFLRKMFFYFIRLMNIYLLDYIPPVFLCVIF